MWPEIYVGQWTMTSIAVAEQTYPWQWQGQSVRICYESVGRGRPLLLLPSMSTVSSRGEMRPLAEALADGVESILIDWPGFGDSDRLKLDYSAVLFSQFLADFVRDVVMVRWPGPIAALAAGHGAGYLLGTVQAGIGDWSRLVLAAPTWAGPLRVMGVGEEVRSGVQRLVRSPLLGQGLYKLNTAQAVLRYMYAEHVYADPSHLTGEFLERKFQLTQQPGARYAPAAFVTGQLDPVESREAFLALARSLPVPLLVAIGADCPPKSGAEMEALVALPGIEVVRLPGALALHEEYAAELAGGVRSFLLT
jgi:pimeloyl-ACP methyl ester carboxylesterase